MDSSTKARRPSEEARVANMTIPTVTVINDALQVSIDVDRSRIFAPDGTTITGASDKFDEIDQANEELLRQARAAQGFLCAPTE